MTNVQAELIIPTGTQVVTRVALHDAAGAVIRPRGAVGVIIASPADASHTYQVHFADGGEAALRRSELSIRKDYQRDGLQLAGTLDEHHLAPYIIYRCVVG